MDKSQLSRLPAELRNEVYEFCFAPSSTCTTLSVVQVGGAIFNHTFRTHIAATQVCRQMRTEIGLQRYLNGKFKVLFYQMVPGREHWASLPIVQRLQAVGAKVLTSMSIFEISFKTMATIHFQKQAPQDDSEPIGGYHLTSASTAASDTGLDMRRSYLFDGTIDAYRDLGDRTVELDRAECENWYAKWPLELEEGLWLRRLPKLHVGQRVAEFGREASM